VNIGTGDQFKPALLAISSNARMPAIVDHDTPDGPLSVFESGAILIHLVDRRPKPAASRATQEHQNKEHSMKPRWPWPLWH
jgi:glutathione S-transferase